MLRLQLLPDYVFEGARVRRAIIICVVIFLIDVGITHWWVASTKYALANMTNQGEVAKGFETQTKDLEGKIAAVAAEVAPITSKEQLVAFVNEAWAAADANAKAATDASLATAIKTPYFTPSRSSRISPIPRFDAPSISKTSIDVPAVISLHEGHVLQGVSVGPISQFRHFAKIRAVEVLPTPRAPQKRNA